MEKVRWLWVSYCLSVVYVRSMERLNMLLWAFHKNTRVCVNSVHSPRPFWAMDLLGLPPPPVVNDRHKVRQHNTQDQQFYKQLFTQDLCQKDITPWSLQKITCIYCTLPPGCIMQDCILLEGGMCTYVLATEVQNAHPGQQKRSYAGSHPLLSWLWQQVSPGYYCLWRNPHSSFQC